MTVRLFYTCLMSAMVKTAPFINKIAGLPRDRQVAALPKHVVYGRHLITAVSVWCTRIYVKRRQEQRYVMHSALQLSVSHDFII